MGALIIIQDVGKRGCVMGRPWNGGLAEVYPPQPLPVPVIPRQGPCLTPTPSGNISRDVDSWKQRTEKVGFNYGQKRNIEE